MPGFCFFSYESTTLPYGIPFLNESRHPHDDLDVMELTKASSFCTLQSNDSNEEFRFGCPLWPFLPNTSRMHLQSAPDAQLSLIYSARFSFSDSFRSHTSISFDNGHRQSNPAALAYCAGLRAIHRRTSIVISNFYESYDAQLIGFICAFTKNGARHIFLRFRFNFVFFASAMDTEKLLWAVKNGDIQSFQDLSLNLKDLSSISANGRSLLHHAADYGQPEICEYLLSKGADLNSVDKYGVTPLLAAIYEDHVACVRVLLEKGAQFVKTPAVSSYMEVAGSQELRDLLRKYGAV